VSTVLLSNPKTITGTIVLDGETNVRLIAQGSIRPLTVAAGGSLTLHRMSIISGFADDGGCIHNSGTLSLVEATVGDCTASQDGAAIYNGPGGDLSIQDSFIQDNTAARDCGGICDYGSSFTM